MAGGTLRQRDFMKCSRCKGFMVSDWFYGMQGEAGPFVCSGWRCLLCGEVLDARIVGNRGTSIGGRGGTEGKIFSGSSKPTGQL